MSQITHPELEGIGKYEYGWSDKTDATYAHAKATS